MYENLKTQSYPLLDAIALIEAVRRQDLQAIERLNESANMATVAHFLTQLLPSAISYGANATGPMDDGIVADFLAQIMLPASIRYGANSGPTEDHPYPRNHAKVAHILARMFPAAIRYGTYSDPNKHAEMVGQLLWGTYSDSMEDTVVDEYLASTVERILSLMGTPSDLGDLPEPDDG